MFSLRGLQKEEPMLTDTHMHLFVLRRDDYCHGPDDEAKVASWGRLASEGMRTSFAAELQ